MSDRMDKVNSEVGHKVDEYILREMDMPRDIFVSITKVKTSRDLRYAAIYITVIPDNRRGTALKVLRKENSRIHSYLKKNLHMKYVPKVNFQIDDQEVYGQEMDTLLSSLNTDTDDQS